MKNLTLLFIFVLSFTAVQANSYKLSITVNKCDKDKALLVKTFGLDVEVLDTIYAYNNKFIYSFSDNDLPGSYQLFFSAKKKLDFIYNFENIEIETDFQYLSEHAIVLKSKENQYLFSYIHDLEKISSKNNLISELYMLYEDDKNFTKRIAKESNKLFLEERKLYDKIEKITENLLVKEAISISKPVLIPQKINTSNENDYLLKHWFDNFNFNNSSIINLKIYNDKVFELFNILVNAELSKEEVEDKIIEGMANLLDKSSQNELIVKYNLNLLSYMFNESDFEMVIIFINEQLIKEKACINEEQEISLKDQIEAFKKLQVGKEAPDFQLAFEDHVFQLSKLESEYTLILFWASWCPHCLDDLPELKNIYEEYRQYGFEIVAISLDTEISMWKKFSKDEEFGWINYCDGKSWDSETVVKYDVNETPKLILIDKNQTIISKPSNSIQLRKKMEELITVNEE